MTTIIRNLSIALSAACLLALPRAISAEPKIYQVTGPVLEVTATTITVQKGDETWQIGREKTTKAPANIKVGDKVTVYYKMTASEIEVKEPSKAPKEKK